MSHPRNAYAVWEPSFVSRILDHLEVQSSDLDLEREYLCRVGDPTEVHPFWPPVFVRRFFLPVFLIATPIFCALGDMRSFGGVDGPKVWLAFCYVGYLALYLCDVILLASAKAVHAYEAELNALVRPMLSRDPGIDLDAIPEYRAMRAREPRSWSGIIGAVFAYIATLALLCVWALS
jgi:hypothetical protein